MRNNNNRLNDIFRYKYEQNLNQKFYNPNYEYDWKENYLNSEAENEKLKNEIKNLLDEKRDLEDNYNTILNEKKKIERKKLEDKKKFQIEIKEQENKWAENINALNIEKNNLIEEKKKLNDENNKMKKVLSNFDEEKMKIKKENKQLEEEKNNLIKNNQILTVEKNNLLDEKKSLEEKFNKLNKEHEEEKNLWTEKCSALNGDKDKLLEKNKKLEEEKKKLNEIYNSVKGDNNKLISENKNLEDKNIQLESEYRIEKNQLIKKYNSLAIENNKLKYKIKDLEDKCNKFENDFSKEKIKYKTLSEESNEMKDIINQLKEKKNILEKNVKDLNLTKQNEIKKLSEEKNLLTTENQKLKENLKNNNKIMNEKNENHKNEISEKINLLKVEKEKNKKLNNQINEVKSQFANDNYEKMKEQIKNQKEIIENLNQKLENTKKEISQLYQQHNSILEEKNNYLNIIKTNETKNEFLENKIEDYYDVVVDINSINSLKNEGWKICYNKRDDYKNIICEDNVKIGVLGLNNVGKSYLLSKLVGMSIPTGYSIETKGISIKYSKGVEKAEKNICILDSAGFESPLLIENKEDKKKQEENLGDKQIEKKEEENAEKEEIIRGEINKFNNSNLENYLKKDKNEDLSKDKAQIERFIEQLILSLSDIIIIVVGKLTRTEQRLINRIKDLARKQEKKKFHSIIIVHNLAQFHKLIEIENHIKKLFNSATFKLKSFIVTGTELYNGREYLVEEKNKDNSEDIDVFHYIMAKDGTEAGNYYNNLTIYLIKQNYNQCNHRTPIDIPKKIIELFSELSPDILGEQMKCQCDKNNENLIKLVDNNNSEKNEKVLKIQDVYNDQDGNYLMNTKKFEPTYSLYYYEKKKKKTKDSDEDDDDDGEEEIEKYLLLRLELPGNIVKLTARSTNQQYEKLNGILIKGTKLKDDFEEIKTNKTFKCLVDKRSYENFSYFIELQKGLFLSENHAKGNTGIYEIDFNKKNKENKENKEKKIDNNNENKNEANNYKEKNNKEKSNKIASGVYVMKFKLTQNSFYENK